MDPKSLTDEVIGLLLTMPKRVKNPKSRETQKAKHFERNYDVVACDGAHEFTFIVRQSTVVPDNFSCGLLWHASPGQKVILTRYNGPDHIHGNPLENESFQFSCHIHTATQRYIQAGRKAEMYAAAKTRYATCADALKCIVEDLNIQGFKGFGPKDGPQHQLFNDGNEPQ